MRLTLSITQFEIADTSPSHFLTFIHNETCDHYYFVHSFDGEISVIKNGDGGAMLAAYESVENRLKAEGWKNHDPNGVERVFDIFPGKADDIRSYQDDDLRIFLSMAIRERYLNSLFSTLYGSHHEKMKEKVVLPRYQTWGEWA